MLCPTSADALTNMCKCLAQHVQIVFKQQIQVLHKGHDITYEQGCGIHGTYTGKPSNTEQILTKMGIDRQKSHLKGQQCNHETRTEDNTSVCLLLTLYPFKSLRTEVF
jgi:hypothetical protein